MNTYKKGLFGLLAVAVIAGTGGAAYAASGNESNEPANEDWSTNGNDHAVTAIGVLHQSYATASADFQTEVAEQAATVKADLEAAGLDGDKTDVITATLSVASGEYDDWISEASNTFKSQVQVASSTAESKDQFIDAYNNAKAQYFDALDAAKNDFAAHVSDHGHEANVAKDTFMNSFNATRDAYGNDLEKIKNDFTTTVDWGM